jgi:hypothetical protein
MAATYYIDASLIAGQATTVMPIFSQIFILRDLPYNFVNF